MIKPIVRTLIRVSFSLLFVAGAAWVVLNRQVLIDWWRLHSYTPTNDIVQLADDDTMIGRGRDLFYTSAPEVQNAADFNQSCPAKGEKTIVLGCYAGQRIFLYNVTDTRLNGVKQVTAAHEMLHAVYERLSDADKAHVNALLKPIIDNMKEKRILDLINLYNQQEPGELYNEMHSILGTEYANLSPELETYYQQYFGNRQKIVSYATQYQALFTDSENKLNQYDQELNQLKAQIDQDNNSLKQQQTDLQSEADQLGQLRSQGNIDQYNAGVPAYNAKVVDFDTLVAKERSLIAQYNTIIGERNQQATAQNNLYQSLNSDYKPVNQN